MSKLNRKQIRKMLLREFKMIGMGSMGSIGAPMGMSDHSHDMMSDHEFAGEDMVHAGSHKGGVSKEDCCKAVLCLIECCDCEITKQKIAECCQDILSSC